MAETQRSFTDEGTVDAAASAAPVTGPTLSAQDATRLLREEWGITGRLTDLGSTQDQIMLVENAGTGRRHVLRATLADSGAEAAHAEHLAIRHFRSRDPGLVVPEAVPTLRDHELVDLDGLRIRLLDWVPGAPMGAAAHLLPRALRCLGRLAARSVTALAGFDHPGLHRRSSWDPRHAVQTVADLTDHFTDVENALIERALAPVAELITGDIAGRLPEQAVHTDIHEHNVVGDFDADGDFVPTGIIDFGDLVWTWRAGEIATPMLAAIARGPEDPVGAALPVLAGYLDVLSLSEAEANALWTLIRARAVLCAALQTVASHQDPDDEGAAKIAAEDWRALRAVLDVDPALATAVVREACGFGAPETDLADLVARQSPSPILRGQDFGPLRPVDLSVESELFSAGNWLDDAAFPPLGADTETAVGRFDEVRLGRPDPTDQAPAALHLGADLFVPVGTEVFAPLDATVVRAEAQAVVLQSRVDTTTFYVRVAGVAAHFPVGHTVRRGAEVAVVAPSTGPLPAHVHVQLGLSPDLPGLGRVRDRAALLTLCADPSPLVGTPTRAEHGKAVERVHEQRAKYVAGAQSTYFETPVHMVRGWRHWLYDSAGRRYLDMINNVAIVGHSHPALTSAAARQMALLNTNSRFLYDAMGEYAERLASTLPEELHTFFFLNSGSEAVDLAVQLARVHTGRRSVVVVEGSYHGWTSDVFALDTLPHDRPRWREELDSHVHVAETPDPYRGRHGARAEPYVESVRRACAEAGPGGGVAAFVAEPLLGSQGGIVPPQGYLAGAYAAVREAGGVCVADEIQVGMGRTGPAFWAFEGQGATPDIVAAAKATGNGHPIGVVACRPEIAAAFGRRAGFFSSTGGGPVSCRIGTAVLDVLRDEGLAANARTVGTYLGAELDALAARFPEIGTVHGEGLYRGVDIVVPGGKEPAPAAATQMCKRMLELGVVIQPTGVELNVLKIKPPLCFDTAAADHFVAQFTRVLEERARSRTASARSIHRHPTTSKAADERNESP
ncbi:aminotransferase [Streptomyces griseiscabiei]|uniref:Aminotransferase n=1 Tax=Streptomyces griseiscabiei TaxID=2993540 RepID=A0ABU4L6R9_9ACTN|nr:aminotransferase [Streptomyces griseiscabiei]MBZ3906497.1 aminotransferase [Streptomyces griseiscabiei]MDX2911495.1 aminotransferase [Streptomyces griseiscabiei]